ncbi:MAG TPA: hypothetical protein VFZ78_07460 [Flavisolibacter sp.]
MKRFLLIPILACFMVLAPVVAEAQCSICTRTAQQLGEKPARGLNFGIMYLAFTPLAIVGFFAFRWWRKNQSQD